MTGTLLKILGALMCVQAVCANVTPVKDFNLEKMTGKWYIVGFATDAQWFVDHKAEMKVGTVVLVATAEGDLSFSYANLKDDGTCWRMTHNANKTDTPGQFTFCSQIWNNDNDMTIADVLYDDYALIYTNKTKVGVSEVLTELYSRTPEASVSLEQRFIQFSLENGILLENIVLLPKNSECPEA